MLLPIAAPIPCHAVRHSTASLITRDGVRLDADVYRPADDRDYPVLLMRQPYGRAIASTVVYAHPAWYAAHGYLVVIQDVRGRGSSTGEFALFRHEMQDGLESVDWAAQLPGSDGQVGMYGFSYQGMTQLYAAAARPTALKALCPAMVAYDLYHDWAYENRAFCLQANLSWALQLAAETARRRADEAQFLTLRSAATNLPLADSIPADPEILRQLAPDSFYHDWRNRPADDPYWVELSPCNLLAEVDLPMLHVGGWFDPLLRGTLALYQAMTQRSAPQHLVVGPWSHLPWGRRAGQRDFGPTAASPIDALQIRWFNYFLKGIGPEPQAEPSMALFEMGCNQWRSFDRWPPAGTAPTRFFLSSNGLASIGSQRGELLTTLPDPPPNTTLPILDWLVHDPWRPMPALGGHASSPAGVWERGGLDDRTDVLTYTSPPLATDLHLWGELMLRICLITDAISVDLSAILSEVTPDGRVYPFSQGYQHLPPPLPAELITLPLQPTCMMIPQGHALRLSLSAACFPAYPVNPGTGAPPQTARSIDATVIRLAIGHDPQQPCSLLVSVAVETAS